MKIELHEIPIREVVKGYKDSQESGVVAYGGLLDVRPAYQREFIYRDEKRNAVIDTVRKNFPLNVMYWVKTKQGTYEVLDGQQRTISICQYINKDYSIDYQYFHNLTADEQEQILDYKLMVYICEGTDKEQLDWFRVINIAGEKLTDQELRNAVYTGEWLTDAKRYFSKTSCPAYQIASKYLNGVANRQDYLQTALRWISAREGKVIEEYMSEHQHDSNANELWLYFKSVIDWVMILFPHYRKEMKGIEWGILYNKYHQNSYDSKVLEQKIVALIDDDDVGSIKGIYEYLFDGLEKHLSLRQFDDKTKKKVYQKQNGICAKCGKHFQLEEMEADHIDPWHEGGKTVIENCQMLCKHCNRTKSGK
jgi:hypothetical protein